MMAQRQGIRSSFAKKFYIFVNFQGGGGCPEPPPPLWIRAWDRTMYALIEIYLKPILSCASAFVRHFAYFLSHAQVFKLTRHSFLNSIRSDLFACLQM